MIYRKLRANQTAMVQHSFPLKVSRVPPRLRDSAGIEIIGSSNRRPRLLTPTLYTSNPPCRPGEFFLPKPSPLTPFCTCPPRLITVAQVGVPPPSQAFVSHPSSSFGPLAHSVPPSPSSPTGHAWSASHQPHSSKPPSPSPIIISPTSPRTAKFFGSGVIIATAFIHLLAPGIEELTSPCLGPAWQDYVRIISAACPSQFNPF